MQYILIARTTTNKDMTPLYIVTAFQTKVVNTVYPVTDDTDCLVPALDRVCSEAAKAAESGFTLIVLSDKKAGKNFVPIR